MGNKSKRRARSKKVNQVALGYCHRAEVSAYFHTSILELREREWIRGNPAPVIAVMSGPKVDSARNRIFERWLEETTATHLLMVDTDMLIPSETIERLLSYDKDIVGGLAFTGIGQLSSVVPAIRVITETDKGPSIEPLWEYPPDSLTQVAAIGAACMLVKREVAEAMLEARGKDHAMPWFAFGMHNGVEIGEDIAFCLTAGKIGYEVWVDTGFVIPHDKHRFITDSEYVLSLSREDHPYYDLREKVPIYQELLNGNSS
jgi:hypothetical protein